MKELVGVHKSVSQIFEILLQTFFMFFQILTKQEIFMVYIEKFKKKFEAKSQNSETHLVLCRPPLALSYAVGFFLVGSQNQGHGSQ